MTETPNICPKCHGTITDFSDENCRTHNRPETVSTQVADELFRRELDEVIEEAE